MDGGFANQRGAGLSMFAHSLRRFVTPVALFLPPTFGDSAFAQSSLKRGGLERGVIRTRSGRTVVTGPATEWLSCLPRLAASRATPSRSGGGPYPRKSTVEFSEPVDILDEVVVELPN